MLSKIFIFFLIYLTLFNQIETKKRVNRRGLGTAVTIGGIVVATIIAGSAFGTASYLIFDEKMKNGECKLLWLY